MQKLIKTIFWLFMAIGFALLILGKGRLPEFYNPEYMAGAAFLSAFAILFPPLLFRPKNPEQEKAIIKLQTIVILAIIVNGIGALGLYKLYLVGFEYDKFVHFFIPFLFMFGGVTLFTNFFNKSFQKALGLTITFVLLGGFAWELFELLADRAFGTEMLGYYGLEVGKDTIIDIIMNVLGILAGAIVIVLRRRKSS